MSLIKVVILLTTLFAFETNGFVQQRWWLSFLPPSHTKFYDPAIKTVLNNTFSPGNAISAKTKPTATISTSKVPTPAKLPGKTKYTPNISTTSSPTEGQTIDPKHILEELNSTTGNNYIFNYFYYINDSAKTNTGNTSTDAAIKEDNDMKYSILSDCAHANKSGVYLVRVALYPRPFMVYCQIIDDEKYGWLVIQQRDIDDPPIDFNRNWADYRAGFGVIDGSYWLGLEKIWAITHSMLHEMVILLLDFDGNFRWYRYNVFSIADEEQNYTLNSLGRRGGAAGDSLKDSEGQKFRTYDRDNEEGCARKMHAGWWYKNCEIGNLNSPFSEEVTANYDGVMWPTFYSDEPLSTVKILIRPKKYDDD